MTIGGGIYKESWRDLVSKAPNDDSPIVLSACGEERRVSIDSYVLRGVLSGARELSYDDNISGICTDEIARRIFSAICDEGLFPTL